MDIILNALTLHDELLSGASGNNSAAAASPMANNLPSQQQEVDMNARGPVSLLPRK